MMHPSEKLRPATVARRKVVTLVLVPGAEHALAQVSQTLKGRGWRVAALRHDAERLGFEMDHPEDHSLAAHFGEVDLVLTAGFKESHFPKILVCCGGVSPLLCRIHSNSCLSPGETPFFEATDIYGIAQYIEERFLEEV